MQNKKSGIFYGYWILLVAFLCQFIQSGIIAYSFPLFVKPLTDEFSWSRGEIMTGSTIWAIVGAFFSPVIGRVIHRVGARKMIAGGAVVLAGGMLLFSLVRALWQFYLIMFVIGVGTSGMAIVPGSIIVANWFDKRRGFAMGILGAGIGVGGFVLSPIVGSLLIPSLGWRATLVFCGLLPLIIIVPLTIILIREKPSDMGLNPDGATEKAAADGKKRSLSGINFAAARRTVPFWLLALAFAVFSIPCMGLFSNQVPHLQDIGFPLTTAAAAISAVGVGSAIGKFGFGWLCDYIKPKYILVIGIILQAGATIILMNVKPDSPVLLIWIEALMLGFGFGSWLPAMTMTVSSTFGLIAYGVIFGFINMVFSLGAAVGPVTAGYIFDAYNSYQPAFILFLVCYAIALPAILLVRRPKMREGSTDEPAPGAH